MVQRATASSRPTEKQVNNNYKKVEGPLSGLIYPDFMIMARSLP